MRGTIEFIEPYTPSGEKHDPRDPRPIHHYETNARAEIEGRVLCYRRVHSLDEVRYHEEQRSKELWKDYLYRDIRHSIGALIMDELFETTKEK